MKILKEKNFSIQRLRAISVLLVLGFHAQIFSKHFGFLGVDIFFVISGFLMHQLYPGFKSNLEVRNFYRKRAQRLLPAFLFTCTLTLLIAFFRLKPYEKNELLESLPFNILGVSNFSYWTTEQYFSTNMFRPLLNIWSLCVEVQFYLIYPVLTILLNKRKYRRFLIIALFCLSFFCYLVLSEASPQTSFFLTPFRLWEFGVGLLASTYYLKPTFVIALIIRIRLVITVILALFLFFLEIFPDLFTQTLARVCVAILAGIWIAHSHGSIKGNSFSRLLNLIGDYSYSIYLLHFPLLMMVNYLPFRGNILGFKSYSSLLLFIPLLFSGVFFCRRWIEVPSLVSIRTFRRSLFVFSPLYLLLPFIYLNSHSVSLLGSNPFEKAAFESQYDRSHFRCGLFYRLNFAKYFLETPDYCQLRSAAFNSRVLLVGNSHADAIKETFAESAISEGFTPFLLQENTNVNEQNLEIFKRSILKLEPNVVFFHSRAGTYQVEAFKEALAFLNNKDIRFVVIQSTPEFDTSIPETIQASHSFSPKLTRFRNHSVSNEDSALRSLTSQFNGTFVETENLFCASSQDNCKYMNIETNQLYYFDSNHLTLSGASVLKAVLVKALKS